MQTLRAQLIPRAAFGTPLSPEACRATEKDGRAALWLGPDEWLLIGDIAT